MILDRKKAPERAAVSSIPAINLEPLKLDEGLNCFTIEGGTEEIIKIDLIFKAGTRFEKKPLESSICINTLKEGTSHFSSEEIAETVDFYGAQIATGLSKDRAEVTLLCQNKHLDKLIDIFTDVFMAPTFPENEIDQYKKRSRSKLAVNLDKVEFKSRLLFSELMFPNSAYRERYDLSYYDAINRQDLVGFFEAHFNLAEAYCAISGKNTAHAAKILQESIANKRSGYSPSTEESTKAEWNYTKGEKWIKKEGAVQTAIRMGAPAVDRLHKDYPALYIANVALGGYFGSRLMQNIREEKGYTYGIGSAINALENASYLSISTQVGAQFTQLTIDEIKKELHAISTQKLNDEELELIQHYIAGNLLKRFDGPFSTSDRLKSIVNNNLGTDWYTNFSKAIFNLDAEQILKVAGKYLNPELFTLAVAGEWEE